MRRNMFRSLMPTFAAVLFVAVVASPAPNRTQPLPSLKLYVFDRGTIHVANTEFALIIAALCMGVGFIAVHLMLTSESVACVYRSVLTHPPAVFWAFTFACRSSGCSTTGPPLLPLRI